MGSSSLDEKETKYEFVSLPRYSEESSPMETEVREGVSRLLSTYIPNVACDKLVHDTHYECIGVVHGDAVVGGTCYRVWPATETGSAFLELSLFAIDVKHQGDGLGASLMSRLQSRAAREHEADTILAYADNRAFAFFSRLGFSRTVTTPFAHWKPKIIDYSLGAVVAEKKLVKRAPLNNSGSAAMKNDIITKCTSNRPNCYCRSGRTRAIVRYDPATGETLATYCSTSDAARKLNLTSPNITHVLTGHKEDANGHRFRYAVEVSWLGGGARPVVEVDVLTGSVIAEYESAKAASRATKISNSTIGMVCSGRVNNVDGRIFRYKDQRVYPCAVCNSDHDSANLLLCDGLDGRCTSTAHTYCIGLDSVPDSDWFCKSCIDKGEHKRDKTVLLAVAAAAAAKKARRERDEQAAAAAAATAAPRLRRQCVAEKKKKARRDANSGDGRRQAENEENSYAKPRLFTAGKRKKRNFTKEAPRREREKPPAALNDPAHNDDECAKCGDGGDLLLCDECPRAYHLECAGLASIPEGSWICEACKPLDKKVISSPEKKRRRIVVDDDEDDEDRVEDVVVEEEEEEEAYQSNSSSGSSYDDDDEDSDSFEAGFD